MKKTFYLMVTRVIMTNALLLLCFLASADPGGLDDDPGVPLDGGTSLLIAAGISYGIKKMHERRKNIAR